MRRPSVLALFLTCFLFQVSAQDSKPSDNASSLAGTVVNEPGSHPLKKVVVQVVAEDQKRGGNYTAITDTDGHFHIENMQPGRYRVFFEKTGFVEINARGQKADVNVIAIPPGKSLDDLMFRMLPNAVITGRITDEDGDPMPGVRVIAQRKIPGSSKKETTSVAATDDLGQYRLAGLFPGQYWIAAMPPPDFRDFQRGTDKSQSNDKPAESRYLTMFYPGTNDASQATPVPLKAGDEMPVNLNLVPARAYRVRGVVTGIPAGQKPIVELTSRTGDSIRASEVGPDGQFEIHGAAPGNYVLKAASGSDLSLLTARQEITVVASDVDGVKLVPAPSFTLSGHLRNDDGSSGNVSIFSVNLRQADLPDDSVFFSEDSFGDTAQVDKQGNFQWKNVNPGTYILRLYGGNGQDNFFLKSARIGDRNIEAAFPVSGPAALDLIVSTKAGTVEGVVTDRDQQGADQPVSNVAVVAVPEEKYRKIAERFGVGATDQYGHFSIHGLAPGSYTLFAWQDVDENLYRDADFLKSQQASGTAFKIEGASTQTINLKLSPVADDWR